MPLASVGLRKIEGENVLCIVHLTCETLEDLHSLYSLSFSFPLRVFFLVTVFVPISCTSSDLFL